ncbi:hypothetical protein OSTOST_22612 [Ostertagia ostertagi]
MFFLDAFLKGLKPQYDDDACDRLNTLYPMLFRHFLSQLALNSMSVNPFSAGFLHSLQEHGNNTVRITASCRTRTLSDQIATFRTA